MGYEVGGGMHEHNPLGNTRKGLVDVYVKSLGVRWIGYGQVEVHCIKRVAIHIDACQSF